MPAVTTDLQIVIRRILRRTREQRGFTLIELMIVVNLMGIFMLVAIPSYLNLKDKAEDGTNKANLRNAKTAINAYWQDNQSYTGMTLAGLLTYNGALDVSKFTLNGVTATTYCVQSPQGSGARVWRLNGPTANYERAHC